MFEHHLRRPLSEELHARPFHDFDGAGRFVRFIYLNAEHKKELNAEIAAFLKNAGQPVPSDDTRFVRADFGAFIFRIERHTEFTSLTFIQKQLEMKKGISDAAFDEARLPGIPFDWVRRLPVPLFHAIWLEIGGHAPKSMTPDEVCQMLGNSRSGPSNILNEGAAQVHFSFDIDAAGYSRIVLFNNRVSPSRMGRITLRLVEMETYRLLALMGLPLVQNLSGNLSDIDKKLTYLTQTLSELIEAEDDSDQNMAHLLSELSALSAELENIASMSDFRLSATKAYRQLFDSRQAALQMGRLDGHQGVAGFINRRMLPAMQTCAAFSDRLNRLADRLARSNELLRTQTELTIQHQNRDLLSSMDKRASLQLRMQQTVEWLSIAALTYYGSGLVETMAKSLPFAQAGLSLVAIKAISVPVLAVLAYLAIRRVSHGAK